MNEHKTSPVGLFIGIAICIVFVALGVAAWVEGPRYGWSRDIRIVVELCLLSALLLSIIFVKYFEAVPLWIASMRAARWFARFDANKQAGVESGTSNDVKPHDRATALRDMLRERHGWRWKYRDRWIAVTGDQPLIERLSPELAQNGYAISGEAVLLHATRVGGHVDTTWLDQIRRLRHGRPVDAIVAVVQTATTSDQSFDIGRTAQLLVHNARALRWAAPAYLLNATEFDRGTSSPDEAIGCTWSGRARMENVDASLRALTDNLADAGVPRLTKSRADRYPAELSQHIARYGRALSVLVAHIGQSGTRQCGAGHSLRAAIHEEHRRRLARQTSYP